MSASLVGSEMCIRDSDYTSAKLHGPDAASKLVPEGPAGAFRATARADSCLLYTSDAADDM
eukprot:6553916-Alexandrium_andersonii.AAC.1